MMWSEGNDFENVELAIQQIKERLSVDIGIALHCIEKCQKKNLRSQRRRRNPIPIRALSTN